MNLEAIAPGLVTSSIPSPYLHIAADRVYNPHTDHLMVEGEAGYAELRRLLEGQAVPEAALAPLRAAGWVVDRDHRLDRQARLRYVSLESHTVCNQACYFCPVSIAPREAYFMPWETYTGIVEQLTAYRDTIEAVFMINYNEPTLDKRFVDQVRLIREAGLPPATLSNGAGLTPAKVDALLEIGGLRYLSINLSTLDRERYAKTRGVDQLELVQRHVDYVADKAVAPTMEIVVLGTGDDIHKADFEAIQARYGGSRFEVKYYEVMDRAGLIEIGHKPAQLHKRLRGCENVGSRPLQHLHITPHAKCVLCCEDYEEYHEVGDLAHQSIAEVLESDEFAKYRRWVYGVEEAPADFMCRKCVFALTE